MHNLSNVKMERITMARLDFLFEHFTWDGKTCDTIGSFEAGGVRWSSRD